MRKPLEEVQKITAHLPKKLLADAQEVTNKGITETLKEALEQLARIKVYEGLKRFKGKYKFAHDLNRLREDR